MVITTTYVAILLLAILFTATIAMLEVPFIVSKYSQQTLRRGEHFLLTVLVLLIIYLCFVNFPVTLTLLVFGTGIIALIDLLFFARKRKANKKKHSILVENARGFFPVLLLVWVIRSFIIQPYHVPTGSLEPTVMAGDFIVVNQFSYGLRFPIGNVKFLNLGEPKTGDIVLFYYPPNPSMVFVKRVIGTPGDHVVYKNKVLTINGKEEPQQLLGTSDDVEPGTEPISVQLKSENLDGVVHQIFVKPFGGETADFDIVVPADMYFMMGDNRDNSDDSRMWGFVPEQNLIGKAFGIWMSWDANQNRIRWDRIGKAVH